MTGTMERAPHAHVRNAWSKTSSAAADDSFATEDAESDPFRDVFHMADLRLMLEGCGAYDGIDIILTRAEVLDTAGSMAKARLGAPIESDEEEADEGGNSHVRFAPDTKEEEAGGTDDKKRR